MVPFFKKNTVLSQAVFETKSNSGPRHPSATDFGHQDLGRLADDGHLAVFIQDIYKTKKEQQYIKNPLNKL